MQQLAQGRIDAQPAKLLAVDVRVHGGHRQFVVSPKQLAHLLTRTDEIRAGHGMVGTYMHARCRQLVVSPTSSRTYVAFRSSGHSACGFESS